MHRIDVPSATVDNKFTEGSPAGGVPATTVAADWLNDLQENVCTVITEAGLPLAKGRAEDLVDAIRVIVESAIGGVSAGSVVAFAAQTAPAGWMKANGAAISRTTYSELFAVIGTTYGAGDGSTTFNLPDLRSEFIRGWDDSRNQDPGRVFGSFQKGTVVAFDLSSSGATVDCLRGTAAQIGGDVINPAAYSGVSDSYVSTTNNEAITASVALSVRPRNVAMLFCIKY